MAGGSRFPALRTLISGTASAGAIVAPQADDNAGTPPAPAAPAVDAAAVDTAVQAEIDAAVTAANTRWNTVMTSDAGIANPKAAARALHGSNMSAEDIIAMLGDMAPAPAATGAAPAVVPDANAAGNQSMQDRLRENADLKTDTGGANAGATGAGKSASERRKERIAANNANTQKLAGKNVRLKGGEVGVQ